MVEEELATGTDDNHNQISRSQRLTRHFNCDGVGWNRHILSTNEPKRRHEHVEYYPPPCRNARA